MKHYNLQDLFFSFRFFGYINTCVYIYCGLTNSKLNFSLKKKKIKKASFGPIILDLSDVYSNLAQQAFTLLRIKVNFSVKRRNHFYGLDSSL